MSVRGMDFLCSVYGLLPSAAPWTNETSHGLRIPGPGTPTSKPPYGVQGQRANRQAGETPNCQSKGDKQPKGSFFPGRRSAQFQEGEREIDLVLAAVI